MEQAATSAATGQSRHRLNKITLDQKSLGRVSANIEHEREVAIFDLIDGNVFEVADADSGPYDLHLGIVDDRLDLAITPTTGGDEIKNQIALTPLKRLMKDYFLVCESYYDAVRTAPPARIQAIDTSRRALHREGSVVLQDSLAPSIIVDDETARRLFTLVCSLHWKG